MLHTTQSTRGMVCAPHHLAAQAGRDVLRDGGNAIEAMVAAAATIAVVYPHMNSIGGDGFWLIHTPGSEPVAIDACGAAGQAVTESFYRDRGYDTIPSRGPLAANTVAGTISGWQLALQLSSQWGGQIALQRLLEEAVYYADNGVAVTSGQHQLTLQKQAELQDVSGFATAFLQDGHSPEYGSIRRNTRLADILRSLSRHGLDDFYQGTVARMIAADLERAGSPLTATDLADHQARQVQPLSCQLSAGKVYNLPPPTQGLASLLILALFDRIAAEQAEEFAYLHRMVEAIKQAFLIRDEVVTDPAYMDSDAQSWLSDSVIEQRLQNIDLQRALPWPVPSQHGDTIWMGAVDSAGRAVSFIQSIYWEFGSGVVLEDSGIHWQNRGSSFQLAPAAKDYLRPGRKPFHTLNPSLAIFNDGRVMPYGTMGGEGQPQTQAAIFSRYAMYQQSLQQAVTAPRWLLGRTWGENSTTLKLEARFGNDLIEQLKQAGHEVQIVDEFSPVMGHAGALVRHPEGLIEGASDPRSDGSAAGF